MNIKKILAGSLCCMFWIGCENNPEEERNTPKDSISTGNKTEQLTRELKPFWVYDHEKGLPLKIDDLQVENLQATELIDLLNRENAKDSLKLKLLKTSADTIYVEVVNSRILTQRMGSMGADAFLSVSTFTLTEMKGINYVDFHFTVGDHANPGTYSRQYFIDKYEVNRKMNQ